MPELQIRQTALFSKWLSSLRDQLVKVRIVSRIERLATGNPGQTRSVGSSVLELKMDFGPGYRVYYIQRGSHLVVLLCGGDKSTQQEDIRKAIQLARQFDEDESNAT